VETTWTPRPLDGVDGRIGGRLLMRSTRRLSISRSTRLCMSLAGNPTDIGTRFHNYLYDQLDLDFVYKAFTTSDLPGAIAGIRALGIRGCGVSMPFKEACIPLVDELDPSAAAIQSVNTIVNDDGLLRAYNTDYLAIRALLARHAVPSGTRFALLGSGGMAKAVAAALRDAGFADGTVVARNQATGTALAERYGLEYRGRLGDARPGLLVNATPVGMAGGPDPNGLPAEEAAVDAAGYVLDVVAAPAATPLIRRANDNRQTVISGVEVIALQAVEQFVLYTRVRPSDDEVRRASEFSRA
jgi:shikimate dehydrogenase